MEHLYFQIPTNLLYSPFGRSEPFGLIWVLGWVINTTRSGALQPQWSGGVGLKIDKTVFGIETRYTVSRSSGCVGFALTGTWALQF